MRGRRPPLERTQNEPDQVRYLVRHAEELDRNELLGWQGLTGVMPAGATVYAVRHSLGRGYSHAWVTGVHGTTDVPVVLTARVAEQLGIDPRYYVAVAMSAPATVDFEFTMVAF